VLVILIGMIIYRCIKRCISDDYRDTNGENINSNRKNNCKISENQKNVINLEMRDLEKEMETELEKY